MAIAAGNSHSLFLKSDGSLWTMGYNGDGELGDGTTVSHDVPEEIVTSGVTAVAAGSFHNLFIRKHGNLSHLVTELWSFGLNNMGQLGDGTVNIAIQPEQIVPSNVTAIAAGEEHSLFIKSDGSLWGVGYNADGGLGDGTDSEHHTPEQIVTSGVTAIAAGYAHSLFIRSDGSLWGMGYNADGELGDGTTDNDYFVVLQPELIFGTPPALGISTYGNQPIVFFPSVSGINHVLQMTTNLASGNWVTVSNGIPCTATIVSNLPANAFFRLQ